MWRAGIIALGLLLVGTASGQDSAEKNDEQILKEGGLPADGPGLLAALRKLPATAEQRRQAAGLIEQLGDRDFFIREAAQEQLRNLLPGAVVVLRPALRSDDAEVVDRVRTLLRSLERDGTFARYRAAVRVLLKKPPEGTCEGLLALLSVCNDELAEEVLDALVRLTGKNEALPGVVSRALEEADPGRRAAAALLLGRSGTVEQRRKVQELLNDASLEVRLRAALGLLAARDRSGLSVLVQAIREGTPSQASIANDLLISLAGSSGAGALDCNTPSQRQNLAQSWDTWLQNAGKTLDLSRADVEYGSLNRTVAAVQLTRRFLGCLEMGDIQRVKPMLGLPYTHFDGTTATTPQEIDNITNNQGWNVASRSDQQTTRVLPLESLPRQAANVARGVTGRHPREELLAVETVNRFAQPGLGSRTILFVRVPRTGGSPRVVGYVYMNLERGGF